MQFLAQPLRTRVGQRLAAQISDYGICNAITGDVVVNLLFSFARDQHGGSAVTAAEA